MRISSFNDIQGNIQVNSAIRVFSDLLFHVEDVLVVRAFNLFLFRFWLRFLTFYAFFGHFVYLNICELLLFILNQLHTSKIVAFLYILPIIRDVTSILLLL